MINTILQLDLPVENNISFNGVTLLTAQSVEQLLHDKRRLELVQPFKLALLKLASQEAARIMAAGEYEKALPIALDAVKQGQILFKPSPALQLFPLYLLAAQVLSQGCYSVYSIPNICGSTEMFQCCNLNMIMLEMISLDCLIQCK